MAISAAYEKSRTASYSKDENILASNESGAPDPKRRKSNDPAVAVKQSIYQSAIKRICVDNNAPTTKTSELIEKYSGNEDELFVKLCRKFDVQPSFYLEIESGIREDYR